MMPPKTTGKPAENQDETLTEPIDELMELAATDPTVYLRVEELDPTTGKSEYVTEFHQGKFRLDALAAACGAGEYRIIARDRSGYRGRCTYTVSEKAAQLARQASPPPPPQDDAQETRDDVAEVLGAIVQRLEALESRREEPTRDPGRVSIDLVELVRAGIAGLGPAASFITAMRSGRKGAESLLEPIIRTQSAILEQNAKAIDLRVKDAEAREKIREIEDGDDVDDSPNWRGILVGLGEQFARAHGGKLLEILASKLTNEQFADITSRTIGLFETEDSE